MDGSIYMDIRTRIVALIFVIVLSAGCSQKPKPEDTMLAPVCCASLETIPFYQIANPEFKQRFEIAPDTSPVFEFESGVSTFQAVRLPEHVGTINFRVGSVLENQVFFPYFLVLDEKLSVIQKVAASRENIRYGTIRKSVYVDTQFELDTNPYNLGSARYVVMYTKPSEIGLFTSFKSAETLRSDEQGYAPPIAADPTLPHGYYGTLQVEISPKTFGNVTNQQLKEKEARTAEKTTPQATSNNVSPVVVAPVVVDEPATAVPAKSKPSSQMLQESEDFYNQLITTFVNEGEVDKALKLVEEAEKAGSKSARDAFIEAVKNK
ncbi:MalM family protein [Agarivorans aestuarii]|uniref:MalM family protein n=1 Tax=Agarivorans aestuarii TaxID=1563703 RepID=A0ABU7G8P6_9ALTE|nr:MalM family protein [Agarivorans aestuarii]MEE1675630.1 MalM family protein [Agarivorans aestuarii]